MKMCSGFIPLAPQKQERRGGIETVEAAKKYGVSQPRSRNAVVALKRSWARPSGVGSTEAGTPWWH